MAIALTTIELKLLRLVMDGAAAPGEVANGATKLVESLRKRGISAEEIELAFASRTVPPKYTRPDFGLIVCPFKKHKDEQARDIDPSYLRFMIGRIRAHPDPAFAQKFGQWADDMEQVSQSMS
jgi:hypothetical protein